MPTPLAPRALAEHADFVRRLAWCLVRDDADADDVAQEALARAIARPPADGEQPRPWLAGVVRNVVRHLRRDAVRRDRRERVAARPERVAGPDALAARAETVRDLAAAVAALDEPYRTVVLLRYYEALPPRAIAARLGIPVETVHGRLKRARERLRARLDELDRRGASAWRPLLGGLFTPGDRPPTGAGAGPLGILGGTIAMAGHTKTAAIAATILLLAGGAYLGLRPSAGAPAPGDSAAPGPQIAGPLPVGDLPSAPPTLAGLAADPRTGPPPAVSSTVPPTPGKPAPEANVIGVCVDGEGKPVARATVYVLPKTLPGLDELRGPHATCDDEGKFALVAGATAGTWIGAVKDGYLPAHADGDALPDPSAVRLVLAAGGLVVVHVEADDPEALRVASADVSADVPAQASEYPAPGEPRPAWASAELDPDGTARIRIGTHGPVRVKASGSGWMWVCEPAEIRLERAEGDVTFRLVRSCLLRIRVLAADGRRPFDGPIQAQLTDAATGTLVTGVTFSNPDATGAIDDEDGVRTGTYRVKVASDGFVAWTSEPFTLRHPGEAITVRAVLVPDPANASGVIVLTVPAAPREGTCWYRDPKARRGEGAPGVTLRRKGGAWGDVRGAGDMPAMDGPTDPAAWDGAARILRLKGVPPGSYDALVWDRSTWTCGYVAGLSVPAGGIANATVRLVPGVRVKLQDLAGPQAVLIKGLRLRAEGVEGLPATEFPSASSSQTYGDYPAPPDVVLAPLPFDVVWASFVAPDGTRKEIAVRATPVK